MLASKNLLASETSPYLLQHADNPVHWRPWSRAALDEAKALDKPILLSIGYAACHWCHVMAHESFEDGHVADVMNRLFVNIKVDREERPEIDQVYMAALTATGEQGGWPLTMFLDPDGRPFWGGTYFPKTSAHGRPGFIDVMQAVHKAWLEKNDALKESAAALSSHISTQLNAAESNAPSATAALADLATQIASRTDRKNGGLRGAPKFPNAPFLNVLWLDWLERGTVNHRDIVLETVRAMVSGGIYDHIGGGMARYATDEAWIVPHFEKMLYDNAQLLQLLCYAFAETSDDLFRIRIEETVNWILRDLRLDTKGFASSLDADSDGGEGRFYLWEELEVRTLLGEDADTFFESFTFPKPAGWNDAPILHRRGKTVHSDPKREAALRSMLEQLRKHRDHRPKPARDNKVLVDWNGLAIRALADASRLLDRPEWWGAARDAFRFVSESMVDGRLPHSICDGQSRFPALSGDYAAMIGASVALYQCDNDPAYLEQAERWVDSLLTWYSDKSQTGFFLTASDATDVPIRIRGDVDEAIPSANAMIIEALGRLAALRGDHALHQRVQTAARSALRRTARQPFGRAGITYAAALVHNPHKLLMVEPLENDRFVPVANRNPDPRRVDEKITLNGTRPHILASNVTIDQMRPQAYLCVGTTCRPPIADPQILETALRSLKAPQKD